ncbi:MAG: hypothetical protein WC332_01445 [Clostridia bacterium]|jgi:hypothetical protein
MSRYIYKGTTRDGAGKIIASATISVYLAGTTTAASVYEAYTGGTAVNSVTSGTDGTFTFYVSDADYTAGAQKFKIVMSKSGYSSQTYDYISIYDIDSDALTLNTPTLTSPTISGTITTTGLKGIEILLSTTTIALNADADTTIYTVPTGVTCVLTKAILVAGANANSTDFSIGQNGAETDWLPTNQLDNLDASGDAIILMPVPATTPTKCKAYAATTVIQAKVSNQAGGATNTLFLFGILY